MTKVTNKKGISRIDSGSTRGWYVRGYRNGKTYSKLFSDKKCSRKHSDPDYLTSNFQQACSLLEAQKYRDKLHKKLKAIPKNQRPRRFVAKDRRNRSGVIGVIKIKRKAKDGSVIESYSVSWRPEEGVQRCTSFSCRKYGEKKAFDLACSHRKNMLIKIYGMSAANRS